MSDNLLFVELGAGGHHTLYSKIILEEGYSGHFLVSSETWESLPVSTRDTQQAKVHIVPGVAWDRKKQVALIFEFLRAHPEVTQCFVLSYVEIFFPLLLRWLTAGMGTGCRVPISGLWIADNLFEARNRSLERRLRWFLLYSLLATMLTVSRRMHFLFLNADFAAAFHRLSWLRARARWCPDPLAVDAAAFSMPPPPRSGVPCLLFAGYHLERKGTTWALDALSAWTKPLHIIVAGPLEHPRLTHELIGKLPGCVTTLVDPQRLSDATLAEHFRASDFVVLPYRKFGGSSGIFIHALHHGKPLLVTDYGMIGRQVRALDCGRVFRPDDRADFLCQLDLLISTPPDLNNNRQVTDFLAQRSATAFYRLILSAVPGKPVQS